MLKKEDENYNVKYSHSEDEQLKEKEDINNSEDLPVVSLEPPDGGWAWMIFLGSCISVASMTIPIGVYGIFYYDVLMQSDVSTSTVTWIFNIQQAMWNLFPIFSAPLCAIFGFRKVAFAGGFIGSVSIILSGFATKPYQIFLLYSFTYGSSLGMVFPSVNYILTQYFKIYRGRATGCMMAFIGVSFFLTPIMVVKLQSEYGYKWTRFISGAIMLNTCMAACLFQPIEWHAKAKKDDESKEVTKDLLQNSFSQLSLCENQKENWRKTLTHEIKVKRIRQLSECPGNSYDLSTLDNLEKHGKNNKKSKTNIYQSLQSIRDDIFSTKEEPDLTEMRNIQILLAKEAGRRRVRYISECSMNSFNSLNELPIPDRMLGNSRVRARGGESGDINERCNKNDTSWKTSIIQFIKSILKNLSIVKSHRVKIIIAAFPLICISNSVSLMMIPFHLIGNGIGVQEVSWIVSMYAIGSTIARILVSILIDKLPLSTKYYFMSGSLWVSLGILALTVSNEIWWLQAASFLFGSGFGIVVPLLTLINIDLIGLEYLPQSYSMTTSSIGFFTVISAPLIGFLRDFTQSYVITLRMLSSMALLSSLLFLFMPFAQRSDKRRGVAQLHDVESGCK